jgi:predicted MFS family arabinose efflux permease
VTELVASFCGAALAFLAVAAMFGYDAATVVAAMIGVVLVVWSWWVRRRD